MALHEGLHAAGGAPALATGPGLQGRVQARGTGDLALAPRRTLLLFLPFFQLPSLAQALVFWGVCLTHTCPKLLVAPCLALCVFLP